MFSELIWPQSGADRELEGLAEDVTLYELDLYYEKAREVRLSLI